MTDSRWPILGLDGDATEAQIRRAYAARLRAQGSDAAVAQFAALRTEFESALAHIRSSQPTSDDDISRRVRADPAVDGGAVERARCATAAIRALLSVGDLAAACRRYDAARAASEIGFGDETEIETELAHAWLADDGLSDAALAEIARRYRWDEVGSTFALAPRIVARLGKAAGPAPKPGTRFIGTWNWGAFCLTPFWLFAHGRARLAVRVLLLSLLLAVVPFGVLGVAWIAYTYGRRGNAIAVNHRTFRDEEQFVAVQDAWRNWGLSVAIGAAVIVIAALVAVAR